ncbi:MAG: hypothetical protein U1F54_18230 [Burkholderiales bacterium]
MSSPPRLTGRLPADYADYIARHPADHAVGRSVVYGGPLDPGERLGRQGDENFRDSVLIGHRDSMKIILWLDEGAADAAAAWRYRLATGAEWSVVAEYPSLDALLAALRAERPTAMTHGSGRKRGRTPSERGRR